jgi:GNAT superfamily N-acetyltransferase
MRTCMSSSFRCTSSGPPFAPSPHPAPQNPIIGRRENVPVPVPVEILPPDTALAFSAMHELRPGLASCEEFVKQVDEIQRPEGYRLIAVLPEESADAVAVAGFRLGTSLSWGRHLYVDDLSTVSSARRHGFAGHLLEWIRNEANRLGCHEIHLDSGVGPNRHAAHRLYLNAGYVITAHHFVGRNL